VTNFPLSRPGFFLAVALVMLAAISVPSANAQTEGGVERAEAEAAAAYEQFVALNDEVDAAIAAYEEIQGETFDLEYRMERLEDRVAKDGDVARDLYKQAEELALAAYMSGSRSNVNLALEAASIQEMVTSQALFEKAAELSIASLDRLEAVSRELERLKSDLSVDRSRLKELEADATVAIEQIRLVQAAALEWYERQDAEASAAREAWKAELERRRLVEAAARAAAEARRVAAEAQRIADQAAAEAEKARQEAEEAARTPPPTTAPPDQDSEPAPGGQNESGVYDQLACPQADPNWFRDTWGARRSGGRKHQGTDIFSAKGTEVYAVAGGTLRTRTGGLGGIALWLYGDDGNAYYYAHLDGWAPSIETGSRVDRNDLIAFVGNTGNASGGANHTHFQLHPDGGSPINPYPTLSAIC
jgi:murein DD-endopeptidase MepM/ murein hydrolase activator NlpD